MQLHNLNHLRTLDLVLENLHRQHQINKPLPHHKQPVACSRTLANPPARASFPIPLLPPIQDQTLLPLQVSAFRNQQTILNRSPLQHSILCSQKPMTSQPTLLQKLISRSCLDSHSLRLLLHPQALPSQPPPLSLQPLIPSHSKLLPHNRNHLYSHLPRRPHPQATSSQSLHLLQLKLHKHQRPVASPSPA